MINKLGKFLFVLFLTILFSSCAGYRVTKVTENSIILGNKKEYVIKKIGKPFKVNSYTKDGKLFENIYYKEAVDVSSYTYILTSILTFEDSILIKIEQIEESTPDMLLKIDAKSP